MKNRLPALLAVLACVATLTACKTPQAALDQANNGAALTVSLQAQLAELRATQANIAKARIERIRNINAMIARYEAQAAFDDGNLAAAGAGSASQLASQLRMQADSLANADQALATTLAALDANMASLLKTVPSEDAKLGATQKAMAALGEEMPLEERARVIGAFAADLKKSIDTIKQQNQPAAEPAQPAPLQASAGNVP